MDTVVAEGQRDALPLKDVTFSTSYNNCHEWTSDWVSYEQVNRSQKVCVCVPTCNCLFMLWYVLPLFTILGTFVFSHYEQVYRTRKVWICGPMFIGLIFLFWWVLPPLKIFETFLTPYTYVYIYIYMSVRVCVLYGAKSDCDFRISDLVKNPDGTDINPLCWISVKSGGPTLLTSSLVPLGSIHIF